MAFHYSPAQLKASLLSHGIGFEMDIFSDLKQEFYENQFVYNQTSKSVLPKHRFPQAILLDNDVISAVLRRDGSPWRLSSNGANLNLTLRGEHVAHITLPEKPTYFGKVLRDGTLAEHVIAVAGERIPGFFLYPDCAYFSEGVPCSFCSVKGTRRSAGKNLVADPSLEQIAEATQLFQKTKWKDIPLVFVTTGSFPNSDEGAKYTARVIRTIYDSLDPKLPIHLLTTPPDSLDLIDKFKDSGVTTIAFNLEVFDRETFAEICPGKQRFVGYDKFLAALDHAKNSFGDYNAFCGFVWGLEPTESTIDGYKYCLDRGISISSNVFHADPKSVFANKPHPTVEQIAEICSEQYRLYKSYPQAGTIFPVSMRSTMDFEIYRGDSI
ncbi:Bacteriochlorophyllide c C-7(1)-hydroxylase [Anaerolineae bacterium]|nr:Bacteriochlorophyllide c C-7(1)-hydroxylase [Anaerolineae bacterium]